ncbi:MAG: ATP-binding protein [Sphingomonadaceae bacterium]|nr:ATP-binding protein [Sphingomonadaceae bacterium]
MNRPHHRSDWPGQWMDWREMRQILSGLMHRRADSSEEEIASELNQTRHRLVILVLIATYVVLINSSFTPEFSISPGAKMVLIYYGFYTPAALGLYFATRRWPGHYPFRRISAIALDAGSLAFSIACEPITLMVMVWVTMGYGMRFGTTYLLIATGITLIATSAMLLSIPWTEMTPYLSATILLIIVAIPAYARWLLNRIDLARAEAEAANLAKSRMLAQASHDLRQPIHAMSLLIVSLEQSGLTPAQRDTVDRIDRSLQGVARLFRSLLDLSTLDSGSVQPRHEAVALGDLLHDLVMQNLQQAEWSGTELRMVDSSAVVLTDRTLLVTMVQNLLSNALKFAEGRAVLIGCRNRGGAVNIEVWDQGIGIAPADQRRVFEEFVQVRERGGRDQQGAGLGLSIVKRMAGLLGLQVTLRSQPGKGSSFAIVGLPRTVPTASHVPSQSRGSADWTPLGGLRVLLVEDDEDVLVATTHLLRSWQCQVETYFDLPGFPQDCDVIVTDFDLGGGATGADVIASVRRAAGRKIPAIVLTGHDGDHIAREINDPAIPILRKPIRPAELRSALLALRA